MKLQLNSRISASHLPALPLRFLFLVESTPAYLSSWVSGGAQMERGWGGKPFFAKYWALHETLPKLPYAVSHAFPLLS